MNIMPWEKYEYTETYLGKKYSRRYKNHDGPTYKRTFQQLPDSRLQSWRKGDLIQFENGFPYGNNIWQEWFLSDKDYIDFLKRIPRNKRRVPLYAANQYGIVIGRYCIRKDKGTIYRDYGTVIIMLTGSRKGHIRKYYSSSPFYIISTFPHKKVPTQLKNFSSITLNHKEDSDESRNSFVSKLYKKLTNRRFNL